MSDQFDKLPPKQRLAASKTVIGIYAGSSRAARDTTLPTSQHLPSSAGRTVVISPIEDPEAVEDIRVIPSVEDLDALFIGRVGLTVAYGSEGPDDDRMIAAIRTVCSAAKRAGKPVKTLLPCPSDAPPWRSKRATLSCSTLTTAFS